MKLISRKQAIEQGLERYFNGKPCKAHGHLAERLTKTGQCTECKNLKEDDLLSELGLGSPHVVVVKPDIKDKFIVRSKEQANALGLRHYFTNTPCRNQHIAPRFVSNGSCMECVKEHNKKPENVELRKKFKEKNRENHKQYMKEYRQKNKDKVNEYARDYYQKHRKNSKEG